jgi:hypothetical protein
MIQASLSPELVQSIQAIVDYNWADEAEDFENWAREEGLDEAEELSSAGEPQHVFAHLRRVQTFLDQLPAG